MNATHLNDVIFTRNSLNKFIKLIKTEGIKNLDYYLLSDDINVKNVLGYNEFSPTEKKLYNNHIAIVNKSYAWEDPFVSVSSTKAPSILQTNLTKGFFDFPEDISVSATEDQLQITYPISDKNYNPIDEKNDNGSYDFYYMLKSDVLLDVDSIQQFAVLSGTTNSNLSFTPLQVNYATSQEKISLGNSTTAAANLSTSATTYYKKIKPTEYIFNLDNSTTSTDGIIYKLLLNSNSATSQDDIGSLKTAVLNEEIGEIEEGITTIAFPTANYSLIHYADATKHLLQNVKYVKGYTYTNKDLTAETYSLLYNKIIPVKSLDIRSWDSLSTTLNTLFPLITTNTIVLWQPSDLINLYSNYLIMKMKENELDDISISEAYYISSTVNNAHKSLSDAQWIYKVISSTAFNSSTTAKFESNTNIVDYYIPCTDSSAANSTNSIEYNNLYFQKLWYSTTSYDIATSNGLRINNMSTTGIYKVGSTSTTKITSCTHIILIQDIVLEFNNSKNGTIDIQSISSSTITNASAKYTITSNFKMIYYLENPFNNDEEFSSNKILVMPMNNICLEIANTIYSTTGLNRKNYGIFIPDQSNTNIYHLAGYWPQDKFWETSLLKSGKINIWQQHLEDRLNNSINNYQADDSNNTAHTQLNKDKDIFNIVLRSNTSTTALAIPTSINGFYNKDLGFYYKDPIPMSRYGTFKVSYTPLVVDLEQGNTHLLQNIEKVDLALEDIGKTTIYQSLSTTSAGHFAATWAGNEYQYGTIKNDLYTNIDQNNPWANDINEYQLIEDLLPLSIDSSTSYTPPANGITDIFGDKLYVDKIGNKIIPIDFLGFINTPQYIEVNINDVNEDNFGDYYILDNNEHILATEYDFTKTYYRLKLITEEYNNTSSIPLKYDDLSNSWKNMTGNPPPDNIPDFVLGNNFLIYSNISTENINFVFGDKELLVIEDLNELPIDLFTESQRQVLLLPVSFKSEIPNNKLSFSSTATTEDNITTYSYIINWVEDQSDYCIYYKKDPYIFDYLEQVPPLTELDDNLTYYIVSTPSSTSAITLTDIFKDELGITNYFTNTIDEDNSTYGKKCNGTFNVKIELNDKMFDQDNKPQWVYKDMYPISSIQFSAVSNSTTSPRITSRLIPFVDYWTGTELLTFMQKSSYTHTNKSHRFWAFADNNGNIPAATNTAKLSFKIDANRIVYLKNYIDDNDTLIFDSVDSKAKLNLYYPQKLLNRSNALKKKDYVANKDLVHNDSDFTSFGIDSWYTQRNRNYSKLNNSLFFDALYLRRFRVEDSASATNLRYITNSMSQTANHYSGWTATTPPSVDIINNLGIDFDFFNQTISNLQQNSPFLIKLDNKYWAYIGNKIPSAKNMSGNYCFVSPESIIENGQQIYPIYIFTYDSNGTLTNVTIDPNNYYKKQENNTIRLISMAANTTTMTSLCNSIDIANSDTFKKIYTTYLENINLGQNNPYPGGPPVFFSDWSTLALSTTNSNAEDVVRDHYVYTLKLPSNLSIQDDDTYYGYPYHFDMMSTTASIFGDADEDNRYLLTYSLVKEHLPVFSDEEEQRLFSLDKTYTAEDFINKIKLVLTNDNSLDEPYKNKEWHTYIEKSSNGLNITSKEDLTDHKIVNGTLDSLIYHSGHINSSITATYNKVVPIESTSDNGNYKYEYKPGFIKKENGEIVIDYLVYKIEDETQEEYPLFAAKNDEPVTQISDLATEQYIESTSIAIPNDILQNIQLSIAIPSNEDSNLYIEDSSKNIGFRHIFLKIPDHRYTNSYTKEHPFPDINLTIDKDGKLVNKDGEDKSPNGTFSIDSGNEAPGTLVQIRGFNNNGDYIGDLDGSTLNNVNVGDGILVIHDESDAWRKPIIDKMRGLLNIAPEDEGGNIYASIVTAGGISAAKKIKGERLYGAIWNDYAEYRLTADIEPGRCVIETGNGDLVLSTKRLQGGANITSDTFGMGVGESSIAKTPIAVSGRVLAYPYEEKRTYEAGDAVCSGPNGTVSKMTREEIREWPDRIVGYVSEIPNYTIWGTGKVPVNGRIWIKVH